MLTNRSINKGWFRCVGADIRAQISNWFDAKIGRDKKKRHQWLGRLPIAHAYTIYIAMNLKTDQGYDTLTDDELLEKAWKAQFSGTPSVLMDVDVDKDCSVGSSNISISVVISPVLTSNMSVSYSESLEYISSTVRVAFGFV